MFQDGVDRGLWQPGRKERRAFTLREAGMTGLAVQQPQPLLLAKAHTCRQIAGAPFAVVRTLGILTAKPRELVHGLPSILHSSTLSFFFFSFFKCHQVILLFCRFSFQR